MVEKQYVWDCPQCGKRFNSEPLTLGVRNGQLGKIHPICTNCFEKCPNGHTFKYGEKCEICGATRRRYNLIRHLVFGSIPDNTEYFEPRLEVQTNGDRLYVTSFGNYLVPKNPAEKPIFPTSWSILDKTSSASKPVSTTTFYMEENHSGTWTKITQAKFPTSILKEEATETRFHIAYNLTYDKKMVATISETIDFSKTAFPKISVSLGKLSYQVDPNCIPTFEHPCETRQYWDDVGLKDVRWIAEITPTSGNGKWKSKKSGDVDITTDTSAKPLESSADAIFEGDGFEWFTEWRSHGEMPVSTASGKLRVQFDVNALQLDPTFGLTTTGSTSYPSTNYGNTNVETLSSTLTDASYYYVHANKFTLAAPVTLTSLSVYIDTSAGNVIMGIYADAAGVPSGSPVANTGSVAMGGAGAWQTITLGTPVYLATGSYHIALMASSSSAKTRYVAGAADSDKYQSKALAGGFSLPDPALSTTSSTGVISMYVTTVRIKNYIKLTKATLAEAASSVTSMSFYSHATGNFRPAIYTDSSGPATLQWESGSTAATGGGAWDPVNISAGTPTSLSLTAGDYWLAWQWDSANAGPSYAVGGANTGAYLAQAYGTFPASMVGETLSTENWSLYATYTAVYKFVLTNSGNIEVNKGSSVSNTITVTLDTWVPPGDVILAASGLPTGATAAFNPTNGTPNYTSTLTITTSVSCSLGNATITVTGTGGGENNTTSFTLTVTARAFTMIAWIYPSYVTTLRTIIVKGMTSANPTQCSYWFGTNTTELQFSYYNGAWQNYTSSGANIAASNWTRVAVTGYSGNPSALCLYKDGVRITGSWTSGLGVLDMLSNILNCYVGATNVGGTLANIFSGSVARIDMYPIILTGQEIMDDYRDELKRGAPVLSFLCSETSGATVVDSSGHANNGTITGTATWAAHYNIPSGKAVYGLVPRYINRDWGDVNEATSISRATLNKFRKAPQYVETQTPPDFRYRFGQLVPIVDPSIRGTFILDDVRHVFDDRPRSEQVLVSK